MNNFARDAYPAIPEQFGGGKPKTVEILASPGSESLVAELGLGAASSGVRSNPVTLVRETENVYVVRADGEVDSQVLQIDRDVVQAVVILLEDKRSDGEEIASPEATPD